MQESFFVEMRVVVDAEDGGSIAGGVDSDVGLLRL
jgi:hypothetical protein